MRSEILEIANSTPDLVENPSARSRESIKVRVSYAGECSIEDAVSHYLAARENAKESLRTNQ